MQTTLGSIFGEAGSALVLQTLSSWATGWRQQRRRPSALSGAEMQWRVQRS